MQELKREMSFSIRKILIAISFLICFNLKETNAQNFSFLEESETNGISNSVSLSDKGFLLSSAYNITYIRDGIRLIRIDKAGNLIWTKNYSTPYSTTVIDMELDSDSTVLIAGIYYQNYNTSSKRNSFIIKIDTGGNILWSKYYTGNFNATYGNSYLGLTQMKHDNGFIYLTGYYLYETDYQVYQAFILKVNDYGDVIWEKKIYNHSANTFESIVPTINSLFCFGNYYTLGDFGMKPFISKYSLSGEMQWSKFYNDSGFYMRQADNSGDGNIYVGGNFITPSNGLWYPCIKKIDLDGNSIWENYYTSDYSVAETFNIESQSDFGVVQDLEIENLLIWNGGNPAGLLKTNKEGDMEWNKIYDNNLHWFFPHSILFNEDKSALITGTAVGNFTGFVTKTDTLYNTACRDSSLQILSHKVNFPPIDFILLDSTDIFQGDFPVSYQDTSLIKYNFFCPEEYQLPIKDTTKGNAPCETNLSVIVSPNPFDDKSKIYLKSNCNTENEISIYDELGKKIFLGNLNSEGEIIFEKKNLAAGFYVFNIRDIRFNRIVSRGKIIIQ